MSIDLVVSGNLAEDIIFDESHFGGSAGNIALNARAFGLRCGIVSNFGKDPFSERYLEYLENRGVRTDLLQPGIHDIAKCVVTSSLNHSSAKTWIDNGTSDALEALDPTPEQRQLIGEARFIHLTTTPTTLALKLCGIKKTGSLLAYEPGPLIDDTDTYFSEAVFREADILFLNEEEYDTLDNSVGIASLRRVMRDDQAIITTRGVSDTELVMNNRQKNFPVQPVPDGEIIDSNGAGDAFKSGFYVGLAKSNDLDTAIMYGNLLGRQIVQRQGALLDADACDADLLLPA